MQGRRAQVPVNTSELSFACTNAGAITTSKNIDTADVKNKSITLRCQLCHIRRKWIWARRGVFNHICFGI